MHGVHHTHGVVHMLLLMDQAQHTTLTLCLMAMTGKRLTLLCMSVLRLNHISFCYQFLENMSQPTAEVFMLPH